MKKAIALLLAFALLAIAPASLAETATLTENASGFNLTIDLPAGATVNVQTYDDVPYTFITMADATAPYIYISVAPTEEYNDTTLEALTKDEQETLFTEISGDMDDPSYTIEKTKSGYDYMLIEDASENDSAMLVILYQGYFVQMSVWNAQYAELTKDDTAVATSLLDTLAIVAD